MDIKLAIPVLLLLANCATGFPAEPPIEDPWGRTRGAASQRAACAADEEVQSYLAAMTRSAVGRWQPPRAPTARDFVEMAVCLDDQGEVRCIRAMSASSPDLKESAKAAVREGAPYGAPPPCLVSRLISIRFARPSPDVAFDEDAAVSSSD